VIPGEFSKDARSLVAEAGDVVGQWPDGGEGCCAWVRVEDAS